MGAFLSGSTVWRGTIPPRVAYSNLAGGTLILLGSTLAGGVAVSTLAVGVGGLDRVGSTTGVMGEVSGVSALLVR